MIIVYFENDIITDWQLKAMLMFSGEICFTSQEIQTTWTVFKISEIGIKCDHNEINPTKNFMSLSRNWSVNWLEPVLGQKLGLTDLCSVMKMTS